ncbi:MAG: hydroxymethylglutaryl-CoA lyase [Novosphingobium sp.]
MQRAIEMVEVGPRDGLQNEAKLVLTADKVELIRKCIAAGVTRIEVASFVNPRKVPQMADAEAVVEMLGPFPGVTRIGLVLNLRGAERALAAKVDQLGAVAVASDGFGVRNQGQNSAQSVTEAKAIIAMAKAGGRSAQVTIATAFGCPFEGEIDPAHVVAMARELAEAGPCEVALADTIGVAVPAQVTALVTAVREAIAPLPVRVHFHDTRNTAVANVWAAVEAGAVTVDASLGGLGGCPFAPGALGNVATEDVAYLFARSGIATGLDPDRLLEASHWLAEIMGKALPSSLARATPFPPQGLA